MKIGIGVTTYKRPNECKQVLDRICGTLADNHEYTMLCSVDHEDDGSYAGKIPNGFNVLFHRNGGVAANKNRLLQRLRDNDLVFIFEDDICPSQKGWIDVIIRAIEETGMQHYNFIRYNHVNDRLHKIVRTKSLTLGLYNVNSAQIMVLTKEAIEKIGAFDPRFGKYGFEHSDYTRRCKLAGLCVPAHHDFHYHIFDLDLYIKDLNVDPCYNLTDRTKFSEEGNKIYMDFDPKRIYIPFPEGDY